MDAKMQNRARGTAAQRGYDHKWRVFRRAFLAGHPLCVMCIRDGRVAAASVVDHIVPHKGDPGLFWQDGNHQSLCASCHSSRKQAEESRGYQSDIGPDGWPIDAKHPVHGKR